MAPRVNSYSQPVTAPFANLYLTTALLLVVSSARAQSIAGQRIPCSGGEAAGYACQDVDWLAKLSLADYGGTGASDVWGWTDSLTGREYALAGRTDAVAFVDITDPLNPQYLGYLPSHTGEQSLWRDIKVWLNHAFVVADLAGDNGMQVFDLRQLRDATGAPRAFEETAHYSQVGASHNIAINEDTGFAYLVGSSRNSAKCPRGLHVVDILNPATPTYAGCFTDGRRRWNPDGYIHDAQCVVYRGPDSEHRSKEICITASVTHIMVVDVSDKADIEKLSSSDYPAAGYAHQGWLSEDHRFFFLNDEFDERHDTTKAGARMVIWDLFDLDDPVVHGEYFSPVHTVDHNLYVRGSNVVMANYTSGLRVVDVSDINNPVERGFFDTHPQNDSLHFRGAWTAYPFFESGIIVVSSDPEGLFLLEPTAISLSAFESPETPSHFALADVRPNTLTSTRALTRDGSASGPQVSGLRAPWGGSCPANAPPCESCSCAEATRDKRARLLTSPPVDPARRASRVSKCSMCPNSGTHESRRACLV